MCAQEIYQAKLWCSPFFHERRYFHEAAANAFSFTKQYTHIDSSRDEPAPTGTTTGVSWQ